MSMLSLWTSSFQVLGEIEFVRRSKTFYKHSVQYMKNLISAIKLIVTENLERESQVSENFCLHILIYS